MAALTKDSLENLFAKIDSKLDINVDLYIIGGAAAILGYNIVKQTDDVDLDGAVSESFHKIFAEVAADVGVDVNLSSRGVFFPPDGYRERMSHFIYPKKKLRVWSLNQYDLAISKASRGLGKDFDDIQKIHHVSPFNYAILVSIFNTEFINVVAVGNRREQKMNFLDLIQKLFGDAKFEEAKKDIQF